MKNIKLWSIWIIGAVGLLIVYGTLKLLALNMDEIFFGRTVSLWVIFALLLFLFSKSGAPEKKTRKPVSSPEKNRIPEEVYQQVHEEIKAKRGDSALRAKAIIQAEGDNSRVKSIYIQLRAESIMMARENEKKIHQAPEDTPQTKPAVSPGLLGVAAVVLLVFIINKTEQSKPVPVVPVPVPPSVIKNVIETKPPNKQPVNSTKLNQALELYLQERYTEALPLFEQQAEQGEPIAQFSLGLMYGKGKGVEQDYKQAVNWFHKAADQGDIQAGNNLAAMYSEGLGVDRDYSQAIAWYRKAAEQGDAQAQNNLGSMYNSGLGVEMDDKQAAAWFLLSAQQGYASAQFNLAQMYRNGLGVAQDDKQAIFWYQRAADQGAAGAQYNLGVAYAKGWGVEQNDQQAEFWFRKAAKQGQASAIATLKEREQF